MIVRLKEDITKKEIEVLIQYAQLNTTVTKLENLIKSVDKTIKCQLKDQEKWINASDIYYMESVDKRTYVYSEAEVLRTELRLYQLFEELGELGFVQVNKACIVNINVLESIRPLANSRMSIIKKENIAGYVS